MSQPPDPVSEYAERAIEYVRRALGVPLTYDSETLPVLDHYLRTVPTDQPTALELVIATAGAYFGELVRRHLGGRWETVGEQIGEWRIVLPTGLHFSPAGFVAAAIARGEVGHHDDVLDAPLRMKPYLVDTLGRMGEVTEDEFYSLCGRLDSLEHVNEVLVAVAAKMLGDEAGDGEGEGEGAGTDAADDDAPPVPGEPVN